MYKVTNLLVNVYRTLLSEEGNIMLKRLVLTALTIGLIAFLAMPSHASLVPMSWGFPSMVEKNSLTSFQSMFQEATDVESAEISFPSTLSSCTSSLGFSFPTILQNADATSTLSQIAFQNQEQFAQFAYPWLSIGGSPVPSMGFM
ncbi:conserved hypothetical protein [Methanocella paludicola SANAE]|uniref:Uncharacterized protein n=2 Tax=Methanocella TaxID=570266 RepID=D1YXJ8_METPS|nr:conserved hypothetical protein [Methanocella paludicola SANAE]